jgi:hypothetical protein
MEFALATLKIAINQRAPLAKLRRELIAEWKTPGPAAKVKRNPRTALPFRLGEETIVDTATSLEAVGASVEPEHPPVFQDARCFKAADASRLPKTPIPIERTVRDRAFHLLNTLIQSHQALFKIGEVVPEFFCLCSGLFRSLRSRRNYRFSFFPRLAGGGRCSTILAAAVPVREPAVTPFAPWSSRA